MEHTNEHTLSVKSVGHDRFEGGLEFNLLNPPHDAELGDRVASVSPGLERSCDILRAHGYSDDEALALFDAARASGFKGAELPKPIKVKLTTVSYW
jgi:hypothetical protein